MSTYGSLFTSTIANTNPSNVSTEYVTAYPYNSSDSEVNNRTNFKTKYEGIRYGDAIIETGTMTSNTGAWNADFSYFPHANSSFFKRGGYYKDGSNAGVFAFHDTYGAGYLGIGFRVVLVP